MNITTFFTTACLRYNKIILWVFIILLFLCLSILDKLYTSVLLRSNRYALVFTTDLNIN